MNPKNTYRIIITVANAPRLLGDKNPNKAKTTVSMVPGFGEGLVVAPTIMKS